MGRFNEIYKYKQELTNMLFSNHDLLKLLHYTESNPLNQSRIKNPYLLVNDCVFFSVKNYSTLIDKKSMLFINFRSSAKGDYSTLGDVFIIFDLIIHNSLIEIYDSDGNNRDRRFDILEEIDLYLNGKTIGIGKTMPYSADSLYVNDEYVGYRVTYKLLGLNMNLNNKN